MTHADFQLADIRRTYSKFEEWPFLVISKFGRVQNLPELNQQQVMISRQLSECQGQGSVISCYLCPAHIIGGLCSSGNGATWQPRQVEKENSNSSFLLNSSP